ncbi:regulator of chromosome condensation 1/beta-lactamase-inhibitor protein II [Hyaloraphidium curvatum]|nr:regulator of chromosome condensation 1/beta-lactamase-inhibitor protein II [Hyaloraphidium curvatum]
MRISGLPHRRHFAPSALLSGLSGRRCVSSRRLPSWFKPPGGLAADAEPEPPAAPTRRVLFGWGARNTDGYAIGKPNRGGADGPAAVRPEPLDWKHILQDRLTSLEWRSADGKWIGADYLPHLDSTEVERVAAGHSHSLVALSRFDGLPPLLLAMGLNTRGQLGNGSTSEDYDIAVVSLGEPGDRIVGTSAGRLHSAVLVAREDGSDARLFTFGDNALGQLAIGSRERQLTSPQHVPLPEVPESDGYGEPFDVSVQPWSVMRAVACGLDHTAVLLDRKIAGKRRESYVFTAGWGPDGQLGRPLPAVVDGNGSEAPVHDPVLRMIPSLPPYTSHLFTKGDHTIALMESTGTVWSWGNNEYGQCMYGTPAGPQVNGHYLPVSGQGFGKFQGRIKGRGYAIGCAAAGRASVVLAIGEPTSVHDSDMITSNDVWISGGGVLGLGPDVGTVGKPGSGIKKLAGALAPWIARKEDVHQIFAGLDCFFVVTDKASVFGFGRNQNGQLGLGSDGADFFEATEVEFPMPIAKVVDISVGGDHALAVVDVVM